MLVSDLPHVHAFATGARDTQPPGVQDVVEGLRSVVVVVDPEQLPVEEAMAWLETVAPLRSPPGAARRVVVPAVLGGPDTEEVCQAAGIGAMELVRLLTGTDLTVAVLGFSPGFAYLEGLPPPLDAVPRRARPRTVVPAGSVALAAGYAAVYPHPTPGGWQLVGRTDLALFDASSPPYARLAPGDTVRFVPTSGSADRSQPSQPTQPRRSLPSRRGSSLLVEEPGVLSLVQDGGRDGLAHLGVPRAGPADPLAHRLANGLVGNPPDAPAIEVAARGPRLRALADLLVAAVGADPRVLIDGKEVGHSHVVPLATGQRLTIGPVRGGLRTYLAVSGGVLVPEVLGSRSTDVLTWLGPGPLAPGLELAVGRPAGRAADHLEPDVASAIAPAGAWAVRVVRGPHAGWLGGGLGALASGAFSVAASSDRIGVRLDPVGPPLVRRTGELESQGMVTGAVQVPPDGRPIVLGPDHATLGGYPVAAVVVHADRWMLGQCRPGDTISFVPVELAGAHAALAAARKLSARALAGRYPYPSG